MSSTKRKRVTMKLVTPNPLFVKWITEWRDKAKEQDSKMQYCFSTALQSLKKYPIPLESGKDCKILKGFGDKLCNMLDKKLKEHGNNEQIDLDGTVLAINRPIDKENRKTVKKKNLAASSSSPPKRNSGREYIPLYGSGAYAILVTLYEKSLEPTYPGFQTRLELIRNGQHLSNTSFTKPDPNTKYTAWSSMKTLLSKNLVIKVSNPAKFSLTDQGTILARKLYLSKSEDETTYNKPCTTTSSDVGPSFVENSNSRDGEINREKQFLAACPLERHASSSSTVTDSSSTKNSDECVILPSGTFDVILYVDTQETCGSNTDIHDDPLLAELKQLNVRHEVKHLKVGDYTWICRDKTSKNELVLPYIVERKRMDDFASSIRDGRYHEQKFRLKRCGIQNITYLIESYGSNDCHVGLPLTTLYQAATNTAVHDGFSIKFTENLKATADYLGCLTSLLVNKFQVKTLIGCPKENLEAIKLDDDLVSLMDFKEFNKGSAKSKDVSIRDMFVRILIQIKGMSVEKAIAIVGRYPTPMDLYKAYGDCAKANGEKLLSTVQFGSLKKTVGPILSKTVHQFFTMEAF